MTTETKKVLLSGVKPTGRPHIGNYFGAMRQFVKWQDDYQTMIMIADYHALTSATDPAVLQDDIYNLALDYLAIGLEPDKVILFRQSEVAEHTELAWIFNCLTTMPYLARAHAYKDAVSKNKEVNVGLFTYPLLMAADILLYDTALVPVGKDQQQHIEYARDLAEKFNRLYGQTFSLPEGLICEEVMTVPGLDGQKMSKSYGNTIPLFATDEEIRNLVMQIKTDSKEVGEAKDPDTCHVFALHRLVSEPLLPELEQRYRQGGIGYKESKEILADQLIKLLTPWRERRAVWAKQTETVKDIFTQGGNQARQLASQKMSQIKKNIGLAF